VPAPDCSRRLSRGTGLAVRHMEAFQLRRGHRAGVRISRDLALTAERAPPADDNPDQVLQGGGSPLAIVSGGRCDGRAVGRWGSSSPAEEGSLRAAPSPESTRDQDEDCQAPRPQLCPRALRVTATTKLVPSCHRLASGSELICLPSSERAGAVALRPRGRPRAAPAADVLYTVAAC
jgi:hypothetical protein